MHINTGIVRKNSEVRKNKTVCKVNHNFIIFTKANAILSFKCSCRFSLAKTLHHSYIVLITQFHLLLDLMWPDSISSYRKSNHFLSGLVQSLPLSKALSFSAVSVLLNRLTSENKHSFLALLTVTNALWLTASLWFMCHRVCSSRHSRIYGISGLDIVNCTQHLVGKHQWNSNKRLIEWKQFSQRQISHRWTNIVLLKLII